MTDLVLIRGLPGSGKSYVANILANAQPCEKKRAVHEADTFFLEYGLDSAGVARIVYKFDRRFLGAAHDGCYASTMRDLRGGFDVIVANTFTTVREIERYTNGVARSGMDVNIHVVKTSGEYQNIHGVPDAAIARMKARWEDYPGEMEWL